MTQGLSLRMSYHVAWSIKFEFLLLRHQITFISAHTWRTCNSAVNVCLQSEVWNYSREPDRSGWTWNKQKQQAHIRWQHMYSSELFFILSNKPSLQLFYFLFRLTMLRAASLRVCIISRSCRWVLSTTFTFRRPVCLKRLTVIHALMAVAAMQGADQHIRSGLGFSILPEDTDQENRTSDLQITRC